MKVPELRRILIADDEPDILEISRIALETVGGYQVAVCDSGAELLKRLSDFDPDLVVMDVLMPGMKGLDVLHSLHQVPGFEATPVVFMTGVASENEVKNLEEAGASAVIRKPFDPMTLSKRLDAIWKAVNDI